MKFLRNVRFGVFLYFCFINGRIWQISVLTFWSYLWSFFIYRNILYIKLKLKTFHFDLVLSFLALGSIFVELHCLEVVPFFFCSDFSIEWTHKKVTISGIARNSTTKLTLRKNAANVKIAIVRISLLEILLNWIYLNDHIFI